MTDTLGDEVQSVLKGAGDHIRSNRPDEVRRAQHLRNLESMAKRLAADLETRRTTYTQKLEEDESSAIDARWAELTANPGFIRANTEQKAHQQTFESLRQSNGGAFPKNLSPVLYVIPLILVGVAEWYVNFSTFAAIFVPVFASGSTASPAARCKNRGRGGSYCPSSSELASAWC